MSKRSKIIRILFALPLLALCLFLAVAPKLMQDVSFSRAVYDRHGELLRLTLSHDDKFRLFVPLDHMSPLLVQAVLLHEDKYFYAHPGVNPASVARAAWHHVTGSGRGGASTLTMQLARLKYGLHTRSAFGKAWQMLQALRIELHYSKQEILEAYLNLAPYGSNIEGAGAASAVYFGRTAGDLSLPEALTLAAVPQSPLARSPGRSKTTDTRLMQARNREFGIWVAAHPADARYASLLARPMRYGSKHDLPFIAPQWTTRLLKEHPDATITTTLDSALESQLSLLVRRYVEHRTEQGVANAAGLLVDTRDMGVIASVGSADYFNVRRQGMIDGTRARRSPGSALKPFIYALAFDQGLIHPLSLMTDAPAAYGMYAPENFDHSFEGPISAHDALIRSRNIPALWLTDHLRKPDFYNFLAQARIGKMKPKKTYGLSLALGGVEVTMEEMAQLYAMLMNDGQLQGLRHRVDEPIRGGTHLVSPEAAFITLDILKDTPPPGGSAVADSLPLPVYWKTGTSGGLRDAWTAGIFGPYVLIVWVGDFRGSTHGSYVGIASAAPLFFDLMRAVAAKEHSHDMLQAKASQLHLAREQACSDTGDIGSAFCSAHSAVWLIPGVSPVKSTGIYRRVLVNNDSGKLACRFRAEKTSWRVMQFWPTELTQVFTEAGISKPEPPAWEKGCDGTRTQQAATAPHIESPVKGVSYRMRPKADNRLPLKASLDGATRNAFWFVNNMPVGSAPAGKTLYWDLKPGRYVVRVVDDAGRADSRVVTVE